MLLPLLNAREVLRLGSGDDRQGFVIITQAGSQTFGVVVDNVFHTEEIVIKPLSAKLRHIAIFSGLTILGDGSVVIVLDPNALAQTLGHGAPPRKDYSAETPEQQECLQPDSTSLLLFRCGSERQKAVPLLAVSRIEEIDCSKIETIDVMPLLGFDGKGAVKQQGAQPVLVFSDDDRPMGLAIDHVIDVVDEKLDIKLVDDRPGTLGYAVVRGNTTEIIDPGNLLSVQFKIAPDQPTRATNPFRRVASSDQARATMDQLGK
jgi:two-component system chemotaxis sensor kinase CheA